MGDFAEIAAGAGYIDEISAIVDETLERAERIKSSGHSPKFSGSSVGSCCHETSQILIKPKNMSCARSIALARCASCRGNCARR
jgi:hypothetical protein